MTANKAVQKALPLARYILPPSAGKIELAVLTAEIARMVLIDPDIISTIWNPWKCPLQLLPFLAHAVSVDVWSNEWTEEQKRKVIAASPLVHRLKGTFGAINHALKAFEIDSKIIEWWQDDARRGTFRIEMLYYDGGPIFNSKLQQSAIQSVIAAKPKSRLFTSRAVITARANQYVACYPKTFLSNTAHPLKFGIPTSHCAAYVATVPVYFFSVTAHPKG